MALRIHANQIICGALLMGIVFTVSAQASVTLYNNFGPGDERSGYGMAFGDYGSGYTIDLGFQFSFTGSNSYYLDSVTALICYWDYEGQTGNEVDLWVMTDEDGEPGIVLESFKFVDELANFLDTGGGIIETSSISQPVLAPNTNYWLVGSAPENACGVWLPSSSTDWTVMARRGDKGPWDVFSFKPPYGFRITGTPVNPVVPAPSAALLASLGASCLHWFRRRRTL